MNTKHYLGISGIVGGIIGSLITTLLVSPVTAINDDFGTIIQCSRLEVVDSEGKPRVVLSANVNDFIDGFTDDRHTKSGGISIVGCEVGGRINVSYSNEAIRLFAVNGVQSALDIVRGDGDDERYLVRLASDGPNGGEISVNDRISLGYNLLGGGGFVRVDGGEGKGRALMHVNEHGGAVTTTDKFGRAKILD